MVGMIDMLFNGIGSIGRLDRLGNGMLNLSRLVIQGICNIVRFQLVKRTFHRSVDNIHIHIHIDIGRSQGIIQPIQQVFFIFFIFALAGGFGQGVGHWC